MTDDKTPGIGDNSAPGIAADLLKTLVQRIEGVQTEIDDFLEDRKSIYLEAKSNGFDVKILRKIVARRRREASEVAEEETLIELYLNALGMLD